MLEQVVGDRPHAFGHRLVLGVDAVDPGVVAAVLLRLAINEPIVDRAALEPPPSMPVRFIRQVVELALEARHHPRRRAESRNARCRYRLPRPATSCIRAARTRSARRIRGAASPRFPAGVAPPCGRPYRPRGGRFARRSYRPSP